MNSAEIFRSTAERCYRLAGACTDRRMADALLDYAGECAAKAGCLDRATFAGLVPETPPAADAFGGRQSEPRKL